MDDQQPPPPDDIAAMGSPATPDALRTIVAKHQRTRTRTLGIALAVALVAGPLAGWAIGNSGGGGGQQVATGSSPAGSNADLPASANAPADVSGAVSGGAFASPATNGAKATHLFTRTTSDGITIRAYRVQPPTPPANATTSTTSPAGKAAPQQTLCPRPMTVRPGAPTPAGQSGTSTGGAPPTGANPPLPRCDPGAPPICKATPAALAEVSSDAAVGQSFDPIDDKQPSDALSHLAVSPFGGREG